MIRDAADHESSGSVGVDPSALAPVGRGGIVVVSDPLPLSSVVVPSLFSLISNRRGRSGGMLVVSE